MRTFNFKYENKTFYIVGGSFFEIYKLENDGDVEFFKVNLMAEYNLKSDLWIPIKDFSVPTDKKEFAAQIELVRDEILNGKILMVGCFGGKGRTGLFLSCLLKTFNIQNPINYVRENYNIHACETVEQELFVEEFKRLEKKDVRFGK